METDDGVYERVMRRASISRHVISILLENEARTLTDAEIEHWANTRTPSV